MTIEYSAQLPALARGERHISELDDIEALIRLHRPKVFRVVAFSIGDRDAAESITQDCFLKAYSTRHLFRGECSVNTWLMRIAFNLMRDHKKSRKFRFWWRARQSALDVNEVAKFLPSSVSSPEAQFIARERVELVRQALQELSEKQRSIFLMRFVEDLELPEIAEISGMAVQTVKTHLYRAVGAIRARFGADYERTFD